MSEANKPLITFLIMTAAIMQTIDSTIANVALPRMQGALSASQDEIAWVLTSYIVAAAIMTPLTGWLANRYGRRSVFLFSVAVFTFTSALCGIATDLYEMIFYRLLQGLSGAALIPLSQAILFDINPPEKHGKAMALWGVGVTLGPIIGPVVGGYLTDTYNWRWVFYINVPIGIITFIGLYLILPDTKKIDGRFDFFGFITLSLAVGALQLMLDRGELKDWFGSPEIIIEACIMGVAFYLFLVHMLTYVRPFVSTGLFADRNFIISNIYIFLVVGVLYATLALIPPLLQNQLNYPVFTTGLVTAPRGFGSFISMIVVGRIIGKYDVRLIIGLGLFITIVAMWQMTNFNLLMDSKPIIVTGFLQGLGVGFIFVPVSTLAFTTLDVQYRNEGTAFFSLIRNLGSSVCISIAEAILERNTQILHSTLGENITPYKNLYLPNQKAILELNAELTNQATMMAYNNDFQMMLILSICLLPLVLLLKVPKRNAAPAVVPHVVE